MNKPKSSSDFVKNLLDQEAALNESSFIEQRRELLERLATAERRERLSRRMATVIALVAVAGFSLLYAAAMHQIGDTASWSEWVKDLAGMSIVLLPFTAVLFAVVYFFRHRRDLHRARDEAYKAALENLPRQIDELRRQMNELRRQLLPPNSGQTEKEEPKDRGAFTLVELLMVIAIIGLLAGLIVPALSHAKARSRTVTCASHLSQIGQALTMFEQENGFYPGAGQPGRETNQTVVASDDSWDARIAPYLSGNMAVFSCPGYQPFVYGTATGHAYGYNANGSGQYSNAVLNLGLGFGFEGTIRLVRADDVQSPSEMVAIGDIQLPRELWVNTISPSLPQPFGGITTIVSDRHSSGANMVFCDGHVEFAKQWKWTEATSAARRRWNNDHQPHPETW